MAKAEWRPYFGGSTLEAIFCEQGEQWKPCSLKTTMDGWYDDSDP